MLDALKLLETLHASGVRFVIVGGIAMVLRGSSRVTVDLDICYARDAENLDKLASALAPFHPRLRGAPPELPFLWDARTLASGLNFTLTTDIGDVDVLGEVTGLGGYDKAMQAASTLDVAGQVTSVLTLEGLERTKRAAGRAKDLLDLAEIGEIRKRIK